MLFGSLFLTCVAVASFMALIRWYAGQVDIAEIQKKATESIRKEATQELLKELQKQPPQSGLSKAPLRTLFLCTLPGLRTRVFPLTTPGATGIHFRFSRTHTLQGVESL